MVEDVWERIRNYSKLNQGKQLPLLNTVKGTPFVIEKVADTYVKVDKLPQVNLTKDVFETVHDYLKAQKSWVLIGASRVKTRPNSIEGVIKSTLFKGKMSATSTATWVAAILVYSDVGIKFNMKSRGQALKKY
jgi:hypothetical protein